MKKKQIKRGVNRIGILVGFATAIAWVLFVTEDLSKATPAEWILLILTTIIIGVVGFAVLPILIRIVFWVADGFAKDE